MRGGRKVGVLHLLFKNFQKKKTRPLPHPSSAQAPHLAQLNFNPTTVPSRLTLTPSMPRRVLYSLDAIPPNLQTEEISHYTLESVRLPIPILAKLTCITQFQLYELWVFRTSQQTLNDEKNREFQNIGRMLIGIFAVPEWIRGVIQRMGAYASADCFTKN